MELIPLVLIFLSVSYCSVAVRVVGGDGVTFHFNGKRDRDFCFVSDSSLHINAHMIGAEKNSESWTWISGVSIMTEKLNVFLGARTEKLWDPFLDNLEIKLNGKKLFIPAPGYMSGPSANPSMFQASELSLSITRMRVNEARIEIAGLLDLKVLVEAADAALRTKTNCFSHLNLEFLKLPKTSNMHGVLGQTYNPERLKAAESMASVSSEETISVSMAAMGQEIETPAIAGKVSEYLTSGLWAPDCKFSRFVSKNAKDKQDKVVGNNIIDIIGQEIISRRSGGRRRELWINEGTREDQVNPLRELFHLKGSKRTTVVKEEVDLSALSSLEENLNSKSRKEGMVVAFEASTGVSSVDHNDSELGVLERLDEGVMTE